METGWMLRVLNDFKYECQNQKTHALLKQLIVHHQQYIQRPDTNTQNAFENTREGLTIALQESIANKYTPSVAKIAADLDLHDYMGNTLLNSIEIRLANRMPQEAQPELQNIHNKMAELIKHTNQVIAGLQGLKVSQAEIGEEQVQLNYIIPSHYKNGDYKSFIKANKEMLYIIDTMNHIVGNGASETKIVSTRSGSLLMALISNVETIQALLDVVKTILEIIAITGTAAVAIKKMQESSFSQKVIDAAIEDKEKIFDRKIDELKSNLKDEFNKNNKGNNNQNFHIKINNSVNTIINAHKDGIQIEAIEGPKENDSEDNEGDHPESRINELTAKINQLSQEIETVKNLPYKEVEIGDEDV